MAQTSAKPFFNQDGKTFIRFLRRKIRLKTVREF
jgi:hypothetical protein